MNDGVWVTAITHYQDSIYADSSVIEISKLQGYLSELRKEAVKVLNEQNTDHVIYAHKQYENDTLDRVDFYMLPLADEQFYERTEKLDGVICAVHKRK